MLTVGPTVVCPDCSRLTWEVAERFARLEAASGVCPPFAQTGSTRTQRRQERSLARLPDREGRRARHFASVGLNAAAAPFVPAGAQTEQATRAQGLLDALLASVFVEVDRRRGGLDEKSTDQLVEHLRRASTLSFPPG